MTRLRRRALARLPLTETQVIAIYDTATAGAAVGNGNVTALCESHERLRAELQGAEVLIKDAEAKLAELAAVPYGTVCPAHGVCDACGRPNLPAGNCSRVQCYNHD